MESALKHSTREGMSFLEIEPLSESQVGHQSGKVSRKCMCKDPEAGGIEINVKD